MSRYIDTKWLEDNAKEYSLGYYEEDEWATPLNVLDSAPSIDIVRCGECKYCHYEQESDTYHCYKLFHRFYDVNKHFCSYGQKGDENVETD